MLRLVLFSCSRSALLGHIEQRKSGKINKPLLLAGAIRIPQTGLEPVQYKIPGDFKSPASTIPPLWRGHGGIEAQSRWLDKEKKGWLCELA